MYGVDFTLEELGRTNLWVDFQIIGEAVPGEPMVRYYPDGSGYPGSSAYFEFHEVYCKRIGGEDWWVYRQDRPDWFEFLDKIIEERILQDVETWEENCLERLGEEC